MGKYKQNQNKAKIVNLYTDTCYQTLKTICRFIFCVEVFWLHACLCTMSRQSPWRPEVGHGILLALLWPPKTLYTHT